MTVYDAPLWDTLLDQVRAAHEDSADLMDFCPFATDLTRQEVRSFHIPSSDLLCQDTGLFTDRYNALKAAATAVAPFAHWRQTYKGTQVSRRFLDEFGCFCLIGKGGAFQSAQMNAWLVYMPRGLYYPWHQHPAEEMYLCLAGEAVFRKDGEDDRILRAGGTTLHHSNQPHAMQTLDHPVLAYVVWRNGFGTAPVLTHEDAT